MNGENCKFPKGRIISEWTTGDEECNAYSYEYNISL